ncbi:hypothetical protein K788_0006688 [Paraburkholderia caribensis MBA4]|uniref:Uncharacterized protein n=1 Tax=Paraburkholderia caribensis MBA4 TaxID=1323664 RepID=A0A0P0R4J8_9BURK|nr:hypothetical protein K788_0006688 [Paraburkholderia caribensis MBA4]
MRGRIPRLSRALETPVPPRCATKSGAQCLDFQSAEYDH